MRTLRWIVVMGLLRVGLVGAGVLFGCSPAAEDGDEGPVGQADLRAGAAAEQSVMGDAVAVAPEADAAVKERLADSAPGGQADKVSLPLPGNRMPSGFCYPSTKVWSGPMKWLLAYPAYPYLGKFHRGSDIGEAIGSHVYALADGEVVKNGTSITDAFQKRLWMRFKLSDGSWFYVVYGHVSSSLQKGTVVKACQPLGKIEALSWPHLHFGIHPAGVYEPWGMGSIPTGWDQDPSKLPRDGWVMPWDYLLAHKPQ
jgi:murein DD-endopeptidase MepM/ murein hydrolase activator NlpD